MPDNAVKPILETISPRFVNGAPGSNESIFPRGKVETVNNIGSRTDGGSGDAGLASLAAKKLDLAPTAQQPSSDQGSSVHPQGTLDMGWMKRRPCPFFSSAHEKKLVEETKGRFGKQLFLKTQYVLKVGN
ncbi:hypothetical protein GE061_004280 [Apolygus lucorum]|uniref:Uncharacterized protein n=1 Tax=Apolygus lucorum TaxID=248454 RepID=A0A8S9X078_APOLU|nr:hypothetical protein GE061_004280 [Apolygus lucorum]